MLASGSTDATSQSFDPYRAYLILKQFQETAGERQRRIIRYQLIAICFATVGGAIATKTFLFLYLKLSTMSPKTIGNPTK